MWEFHHLLLEMVKKNAVGKVLCYMKNKAFYCTMKLEGTDSGCKCSSIN